MHSTPISDLEPVRLDGPSDVPADPDRRRIVAPCYQTVERIFVLNGVILGVVASLVGVRVLLTLFAVDPEAMLPNLIYNITTLFILPPTFVLASLPFESLQLDVAAMFAMMVYCFIAWMLTTLALLLFHRHGSTEARWSRP
jgi:hypothetical protein